MRKQSSKTLQKSFIQSRKSKTKVTSSRSQRRYVNVVQLPPEIWVHIFSFINNPSVLLKVSILNTKMRKIVMQDVVWKTLYMSRWKNAQFITSKWYDCFKTKYIEEKKLKVSKCRKKMIKLLKRKPLSLNKITQDCKPRFKLLLKQKGEVMPKVKWYQNGISAFYVIDSKMEKLEEIIINSDVNVDALHYSLDTQKEFLKHEPFTICSSAVLSKNSSTELKEKHPKQKNKIAHNSPKIVEGVSAYLGNWSSTKSQPSELAFILLQVHHYSVLRCIYSEQKAPFDDCDSKYGLHDYTISIELRNMQKSIWNHVFSNCFANDFRENEIVLRLLNHIDDTYSFSGKFQLVLPTLAFQSVIHDAIIAEITVYDEFNRVFWCHSKIVKIQTGDSVHSNAVASRGYDVRGRAWRCITKDDRGCFLMEGEEIDDVNAVKLLEISFPYETVNTYFGRNYSLKSLVTE